MASLGPNELNYDLAESEFQTSFIIGNVMYIYPEVADVAFQTMMLLSGALVCISVLYTL